MRALDYVLQRALGAAEGDQREAFANAIRPQLGLLRKQTTGYNKHLTSSASSTNSRSCCCANAAGAVQRELEKHTPKAVDCA